MIQVYAVTRHPGPRLPIAPALAAVPHAGLAMIVGPLEGGGSAVERMWRYEAVIESLTRGRDLLPMRYGTVLADAAAATAQLAARRDEFARALDRVSGAAEVSVRAAEVTRPTDEPPISDRSSVGVAYLETTAAAARRAAAVGRAIHQPLALAARASIVRNRRRAGELLTAAYLVERTHVAAFGELVGDLQDRHPELALLCTGPWPPYSFTER